MLTIDLTNNKYDFLEVRNVLGQIIYSENNPSNTFTLNVSKYSSNLFLITLNSQENTEVIKVPYVN